MSHVNLGKDTHYAQESIGDIQYLIDLSSNNKEEFDYTIDYLQNQMTRLGSRIKSKRESLVSFMKKHDIEQTFPVLTAIIADDVCQDTVPESNIERDLPLKKNFTDETMDLLRTKLKNKLVDELSERIDSIQKMKLHKAWVEKAYEDLVSAKNEYAKNEAAYGDDYIAIRKDLEDQVSLHDSLGEFKFMFSTAPKDYTSDHLGKAQDNRTGAYGPYYVTKKRVIKAQADKIKDNFSDVDRYIRTNSLGSIDPQYIMETMVAMSAYFGDQGDKPSTSVLPAQYVDAYQIKTDVIKTVDTYMKTINDFMRSIKKSLDTIRGVTGLGNKELDGIYSQVIEIAQSPVNARRIDPTNFEQKSNINKSYLDQRVQDINKFTGYLQQGAKNLDEAFLKIQRGPLLKTIFNMGYPVTYAKDRQKALEDHVREKVRAKFGNIPFEDEQTVQNPDNTTSFVKTSELVKVGGTYHRKTQVEGADLVEKTLRIGR